MKNKIKKLQYNGYLWLAILVGLSSCTLPRLLQVKNETVVPSTYFHVDSVLQKNQNVPQWRSFFKDPYLVALIDTAIKNNQDMKIAGQRMEQAHANMRYHIRNFYPSVQAGASYGVTRFGDYTIDGVGNFDTNLSQNISAEQRIPNPIPDYFLGLQASWEIGFAGKLRNRKKAALERFKASGYYKNYVQTQLVSGVARLYYELLSIDNELKIIRQNLSIQERAMEIVDIQKQSGQINELAVKQFQVQLLQTRALEAERSQHLIFVSNMLNGLTGKFPGEILRADTLINTNQLAQLQTGIPIALLENRPDLKEAMAQLRSNEADLQAARASFFPAFNATGFVAFNGFNTSYLFNPASLAYMGLGSLTMPLLNRKELSYQYRWQAAEKNIAIYNYQKVLLQSVGEVSSLYNTMQAYQQVSNFKLAEVTELKAAINIGNDLFLTGFANYLEVLMIRRNVLESELQYTNAQKQFFHAYIDLYKAMGGGWN
ncbi:MAG: TolC family protein [Cyclobacteriaceae bacterium]|nr:TolC family protein [Cyclobacteriaceae bacterium]UYN85311.1 MAG: TolC family protein [Cyclobacteriaceae bacterium]